MTFAFEDVAVVFTQEEWRAADSSSENVSPGCDAGKLWASGPSGVSWSHLS